MGGAGRGSHVRRPALWAANMPRQRARKPPRLPQGWGRPAAGLLVASASPGWQAPPYSSDTLAPAAQGRGTLGEVGLQHMQVESGRQAL